MKDLPLGEITLRKYEKPQRLDLRTTIKRICLSLGILQPGDSRDIVVDILQVIIMYSEKKKVVSFDKLKEEVIQNRNKHNLKIVGVADSNIRRQLKRLKDLMIIEKFGDGYRLAEFCSLKDIFEKRIKQFYLADIIERIIQYLEFLDNVLKQNKE